MSGTIAVPCYEFPLLNSPAWHLNECQIAFNFKGALNDLITTSRVAMTAMKSGMKAGRKAKELLDREERKSIGDTRKVLSSTNVLFEVCPEKGKPFRL